MRTPKHFSKSLKNGEITKDMLGLVLYSFNKRAKNYRDKERRYREYGHDIYDNIEKYKNKKEKMYDAKEELLKYLCPTCIHVEKIVKDKKVRYYEYEHGFKENLDKAVLYRSYYDSEEGEIKYIEVILGQQEILKYYLYYQIDNFGFHKPIKEEEVNKYNNLKVIELKNFTTFGIDIKELLSINFCEKVLNGLKNGSCTIVL